MTRGIPELAKYYKALGFSKEEFDGKVLELNNKADEILQKAKDLRPADTGMYYPFEELELGESLDDKFVIHCLKMRGMEFFDNNTLYRV